MTSYAGPDPLGWARSLILRFAGNIFSQEHPILQMNLSRLIFSFPMIPILIACPGFRSIANPSQAPQTQSVKILREELNRINALTVNTGTFMIRWMERVRNELQLCKPDELRINHESLSCLKNELKHTVKIGFDEGILSSIEHDQLLILIHKLTLKEDGKMGFKPIRPSLRETLISRRGKKPPVPSLSTYESRANHFRKLRIANGKPESLDPEVLDLLKKTFHRKLITLGRVTPDQYLLAKYSVTQINLMSGLLTDTLRWTDELAIGQILVDSSGIEAKKDRVASLKDQYIQGVARGAAPTELLPLRDEISSLENEISEKDTLNRILNLREERYQLARSLAESRDSAEGSSLRARLSALEQQLEALNEQLESERITLRISAGDLHRLSMNHLETQIEIMRRKPGTMGNFDGNLADLLVAGYLTGALDGAELKAALSIPDFAETHESVLLKSGGLIWRAGRMYLMLNPYTMIPTTMVTVVVSALQQKKEYERATAKKTHLIRQ